MNHYPDEPLGPRVEDEVPEVKVKPKPVLPDDWPTVPRPFGDDWIALPKPFKQIIKHNTMPGCGDCGCRYFTMFTYVRGLKDPLDPKVINYHQETSISCPNCVDVPSDAIIVGEFDVQTNTYELYRR